MTDASWQPAATIERLQQRANIVAAIRAFFLKKKVWEVETPLLAPYAVTDPHMMAISTENPLTDCLGDVVASKANSVDSRSQRFYLQSSPEYAMKRLLAAGSGSIYQISKAFRRSECSRRHNPEFTMLEWYRLGFDHYQLMTEVEELVALVLGVAPAFARYSYQVIFENYLSINPHAASCKELEAKARELLDVQMDSSDKDDWLNILLAEYIEPKLASLGPVFVYDFPASQAALARVTTNDLGHPVAQRFELYVRGMELANGYFELSDAQEQRRRFQQDQQKRQALGREEMAMDESLLAALEAGLPDCAGVALGVDRLVMLALDESVIQRVLAFATGELNTAEHE